MFTSWNGWKVERGWLFLTLKSLYKPGGGWGSRWETRRFGRKRDPRKVAAGQVSATTISATSLVVKVLTRASSHSDMKGPVLLDQMGE